jgi:hypothetical protein
MIGVLAFLLHVAARPAPEPAVVRPRLFFTVRTEGRVGLDAAALTRIAEGVRALWHPYADVQVSNSPDQAIAAPEDETLALVLTDQTLHAHDVGSIGWIEFVNGRPMQTITVSTTAAQSLMDGSSWGGLPLSTFPAAVRQRFLVGTLVRSIAHEIGHYLLRSREHASRGLMRARFSAADILEPGPGINRLEPSQVRTINHHLLLARR